MQFKKFEPRAVTFLEVKEIAGYMLKVYSILYEGNSFNGLLLRQAYDVAVDVLPQPANNKIRPGAGFLIFHQGCGADYLILSWWDNENELPTKIFVYENGWRPAKENESFCVWD